MFDSSVSDVLFFIFSFIFFFFIFVCIKKRRDGSLLCFVSFVPHICHEDWSASRHVEDMNLDMNCPTLCFRFFRRSLMEREGSKIGLLDWTGFSAYFRFLAFLTRSVLLVLATGLASSLYRRIGG